jgi:hypothetical protein
MTRTTLVETGQLSCAGWPVLLLFVCVVPGGWLVLILNWLSTRRTRRNREKEQCSEHESGSQDSGMRQSTSAGCALPQQFGHLSCDAGCIDEQENLPSNRYE